MAHTLMAQLVRVGALGFLILISIHTCHPASTLL